MAVSNSWWRGAAALAVVGLLGLGLGCHHKGAEVPTYSVTGTITYKRIPLNNDSSGVPTGLQTDPTQFQTLPARGVEVRAYQAVTEQDAYGNTTTAWILASSTTTDIYGDYAFSNLTQNLPTFIELDSIESSAGTVKLVADPAGVDSLVPEANRVIYAMRKGIDGSTSTTSATPGVAINWDATVNFSVGLTDTWLMVPINWNAQATSNFPYPPTLAAGSRVLAILDSVYQFAYYYGNPTPAKSLDLHYNPNVRNARGSFVEYDTAVYPLSFDGTAYHYFGSIAGTVQVNDVTYPDDAFYPGIIYPLLARNHLWAQGATVLYPTGQPLTSLTPAMAVIEGFPDAMAAALQASPYLPDPNLPARFPARDIRNTAALTLAQQTAYSAPNISALTWDLILTANFITPPGTALQWSTITPSYLDRLYVLVKPFVLVGKMYVSSDVTSIYSQVATLENDQTANDATDLQLYFNDTNLPTLFSKFNMNWTTAAQLPQYTTPWGEDPNSLVSQIPTFTLSMKHAEKVRGVYPNQSYEEVFYSTFTASEDHVYSIGVKTVPPLPDGATLEVTLDPSAIATNVYLYGGSNPATNLVTVTGNYRDLTNPAWHYMQVRLVSPQVLQPDIAVTMQMPIVSSSDPNVTPVSTGN
jgi:hypothetical protein